jgi:hypothetical protein
MSRSAHSTLPHTVRFLHYRAYDENLRSKTNPLGVDSRTGATIAYTEPSEGKPIAYAASFCHPRDNYNKHLGRTKAMGRLKSNEYLELTTVSDKREFLSLIDSEMEGYGYVRKYSSGAPAHGEAPVVKPEAKAVVQIETGGEAPPVVVLEPAVGSDV